MVDFHRRAVKAAQGRLDPGEEVLAAVPLIASPFIAGATVTGGTIAAGAVGAAVGAVIAGRQRRRDAGRTLPAVAARTAAEPAIPNGGALAAVTPKRVIVWKIGGFGKPKDVLHDIPLDGLDEFVWEETGAKWVAGKPKSFLLWFGLVDGRVLSAAAVAAGPARKHAESVIAAVAAHRPDITSEFRSDT